LESSFQLHLAVILWPVGHAVDSCPTARANASIVKGAINKGRRRVGALAIAWAFAGFAQDVCAVVFIHPFASLSTFC
jgi:hypothetical protein